MDRAKHLLTVRPTPPAHDQLLRLAETICHERGLAPTHWSYTNLGLDSAPWIGLMLWREAQYLAAIDPHGHMSWFAH